jgi:hypothetical protein
VYLAKYRMVRRALCALAAGGLVADDRRPTRAQSQPTKPKRASSSKAKQGAKGVKTQQAADDEEEDDEDDEEGSAGEDDLDEDEDEAGPAAAAAASAPPGEDSSGRNVRPRLDDAGL